jgi:ABC-type multidrug transport system permease subunit
MKSKPLINEKLILAAAIFSPVYFTAMQLVEKYKIDVGHLGQAIVELVTIPTLIMPLFILGYSLIYMLSTKKLSAYLLIAMMCSGLMLSGLIAGLFMDAGV